MLRTRLQVPWRFPFPLLSLLRSVRDLGKWLHPNTSRAPSHGHRSAQVFALPLTNWAALHIPVIEDPSSKRTESSAAKRGTPQRPLHDMQLRRSSNLISSDGSATWTMTGHGLPAPAPGNAPAAGYRTAR